MRSAVLLAACLLGAAVASPGSPTPASCPYQAQVIVYGQNGWETLASALAANPTPCANYYVVVTAIGDKTKPRGRAAVAAIHAKGPNFHALAEFNMGAWAKVKPANWSAKGRLFRQRMSTAGYDPARDTWAVNELSSAVRTKPVSQARARDAMRGLFTGPRGAPPQQGAVFVGLGWSREREPGRVLRERDAGTATRACSPTGSYAWCKAVLGSARFNPGWATFVSW